MTLSLAQAQALGAHLASRYGARVLESDSTEVRVAVALLDSLVTLAPGLRPALESVGLASRKVSRTLPTPLGTMIVLGEDTATDPIEYAEVVAHEATHARQIVTLGGWQTAVDYLGSGELRATREAHAYVVGLWVRYLLTGDLPSPDAAVLALAGGLYHLSTEDVTLARGIVASGIASIDAGAVPPYAVAHDVLAWLVQHAPEAIVPARWRP